MLMPLYGGRTKYRPLYGRIHTNADPSMEEDTPNADRSLATWQGI